MRTMTGYSTASELANENGSIVWCLAISGGLFKLAGSARVNLVHPWLLMIIYGEMRSSK